MTPAPAWAASRVRVLLWMSLPIAALAMAASLAGVLTDSPYAAEAPNWAAQAVGQDVVNVTLIYPGLLLLAWLAGRGSLRAYLGWLGVLGYSAYSFLLYAGFLHFSGWFLVYVAVLGLSVYALIGGIAALDPRSVAAAFSPRTPVRLAGGVLIALGIVFAVLWLAEIVPAAVAGEPLPSAVESGLVVNPVHLLDLAVFLPAMVLVGVLLVRRRPLGFALALPIYVWGAVMGVAVMAMLVSVVAHGEAFEAAAVVTMGLAAAVKLVLAFRLAAAVRAREQEADDRSAERPLLTGA